MTIRSVDLFRPHQRGTAMAIISMGPLMGVFPMMIYG
jgi:hypothetical protein